MLIISNNFFFVFTVFYSTVYFLVFRHNLNYLLSFSLLLTKSHLVSSIYSILYIIYFLLYLGQKAVLLELKHHFSKIKISVRWQISYTRLKIPILISSLPVGIFFSLFTTLLRNSFNTKEWYQIWIRSIFNFF